MRITTSMMSSKYVKNLNQSAEKMNYAHDQVSTGRRFFKGSEDPVSAIRAYKLRREYRENETYGTNIDDADSFLTLAETNLTEISEDIDRVYTSYLRGINGSMNKEDREVIAKELDNIQDSILSSLNAKFADRFIFGGTSKDELPFSLNSDGKLLFKGVDVDTGLDADGNLVDLSELSKEAIYIDIGLGDVAQSDGTLNKENLFNLSMSGIKFMGHGETSDGIPNNLYNLIGEIKTRLRDDNFSNEDVQPYVGKFEQQKTQVLVQITDIGARANYIDFLKVKNDSTLQNLNKSLVDTELIDTAEAITDFTMQEYSYNAALAMGNKILQHSFIDYMK